MGILKNYGLLYTWPWLGMSQGAHVLPPLTKLSFFSQTKKGPSLLIPQVFKPLSRDNESNLENV